MNKKLLILPIFLMFVGCASNSSGSTEERDSKDIPEWALEPPCPETSPPQATQHAPMLYKVVAIHALGLHPLAAHIDHRACHKAS